MKILWWLGWLNPIMFLYFAHWNSEIASAQALAGENYDSAQLGIIASSLLAYAFFLLQIFTRPQKRSAL